MARTYIFRSFATCIAGTALILGCSSPAAAALKEKPAFSLSYDGVPSSTFLAGWSNSSSEEKPEAGVRSRSVTYSKPDEPLKIRVEVREYGAFHAVEWVVWFENTGDRDTALLEDILPLDTVMLRTSPMGDFVLHSARGSFESETDFEPLSTPLTTSNRTKTVLQFPISGRSSDGGNVLGTGRIPFFNIEQPDEKSGLIVAIGWTGQWKATFTPEEAGPLGVSAGLYRTRLRLHPGEKIRTPSILLMSWEGRRDDSQNQFRRLLRQHFSPRPGGQEVNPPFYSSVHGTIGFEETTAQNLTTFIDATAANKLPVEIIAVDAGWYDLFGNTSWNWVGNWTPDPTRFPDGLAPIVAHAHEKGFKFSLWFEPERVAEGSWVDQNHPEWLIKEGAESPFRYLLNLGNPEALAWTKKTFQDLITELKLDIFRQDFNMNTTADMWRSQDAPDRLGMTETLHIMGLYEFWDYLLEKNPNLLLDSCASGGRRIDIETLRRSLCVWRSDICWKSDPEQSINQGLSTWIPLTGRGSISTKPYDVHSGLGSIFGWALNANDPSTWAPAGEFSEAFLKIRHLYREDFYPLTPYTRSNEVWVAWQYHDPDTGEGLVQAFRRGGSQQSSQTFNLQGLDTSARYLVKFPSDNEKQYSGEELANPGLSIHLPEAESSIIITYKVAM